MRLLGRVSGCIRCPGGTQVHTWHFLVTSHAKGDDCEHQNTNAFILREPADRGVARHGADEYASRRSQHHRYTRRHDDHSKRENRRGSAATPTGLQWRRTGPLIPGLPHQRGKPRRTDLARPTTDAPVGRHHDARLKNNRLTPGYDSWRNAHERWPPPRTGPGPSRFRAPRV
jgi:hypothetical protein